MTYFDYASMGIPDKENIQELQKHLGNLTSDIKSNAGGYTVDLLVKMKDIRKFIAHVYDVLPQNIAFIANTTEGLGRIASGLNKSELTINVAVPDIEFMSAALVWQGNSENIHFFNTANGKVNLDEVNQSLATNNILCMSSVQEVSGYRFSFANLAKERNKRSDEYWIVDGIQESGILKRDLHAQQIDAYIAGGHKWLNSPFGLGFMYVSDRLLEKIFPTFDGYLNLQEPHAGWINYLESRERTLYDLHGISRVNEAKSIESGGMINFWGAEMLKKAFERWEKFGHVKAEKHIFNLQELFRKNLQLKGARILGGDDRCNWSSIITLTCDNLDLEKKLLNHLTENNIKVSLRSINGIGGIRIGFHYYTTFEEVKYLINVLNEWGIRMQV
ncbi:aminotransferase class V-fold PLP-dependent enzyme [Virgibacillus ihumii]|uniref:aminotransferase class V-fold PLP-dependent enzyme n=1 Tax=Virgibacillus ihumii TaxID=2686091 RepID=UPI00157DFD3D|nr:aminotransferase class V-fold PLP-dependent enzyme [Virgibacillus ihumii]